MVVVVVVVVSATDIGQLRDEKVGTCAASLLYRKRAAVELLIFERARRALQ